MVKGRQLFDLLVDLTGLDEKSIRTELGGIIHRLHLDAEHLTTEDLRKVVAQYLEDIRAAEAANLQEPFAPAIIAEA